MPIAITKITMVLTGGTIDKTYSEFDMSLSNRKSVVEDTVCSLLRLPYTDINYIPLMSKDSLKMTIQDRELICQTIATHLNSTMPVVIIHGTDTVDKTANICLKKIPNPQAPVVFTGAMRPLDLKGSDGAQNVTEALLASKILQPGIYELNKKSIAVSEILKYSGISYKSQSLRFSKQTILESGKQVLKTISNIDERLKPNDILFVSFLQNPTKSGGIKIIGEVNSKEMFSIDQFPKLSKIFSTQNLLNSDSYTFSILVRRFNNISNKFNYIIVNLSRKNL